MALTTYEQVRPWARSIKTCTAKREMPPWFIEKNIGIQRFKDDPSLNDAEIATIGAWVDAGALRGNPADMPPPRQYADPAGWTIGTPDLIVSSPPPVPPTERQARFNALILPHLDRLLAFAMRRTDAVADAEDAVQEACVRAWRALDDLRDTSRTRAWLYRILRSVLGENEERTARRRQLVSITRLEIAHEEVVGGDGGGDTLFDEIAARLAGEEVRAALAQIPEEFAVAVELHDIDGFKYQEIADIIGVPIGTVMSRISRGRRLLSGAVLANRSASARSSTPGAGRTKGGSR